MLAPYLNLEEVLQRAPYCATLWLTTFIPPALLLIATPKNSLLRWLYFPCSIAQSHHLFTTLFNATPFPGLRVLCAALSINAMAIAWIHLVIDQASPEDMVKAGVFRAEDGLVVKVVKTLGRFCNFRGVGTAWQIKRVAPHSANITKHRGSDGKIPPAQYLKRQILFLIWEYLLLDLSFAAGKIQPPEELHAMIGDSSEFKYHNLTPAEIQGRIVVAFLSWLMNARPVLDVYYRFTSIVAISLGLSTPEIWPPLFGSVADMYTLRGFWSTFWHQYLRWPLTSISNFLARRVLRLRTPSIIERYFNVFLVFFFSGVLHVAVDYYDPTISSDTFLTTMIFFTSFAFGVMMEDAVQAIWRSVSGSGPRKEGAPVPLWHKVVGYIWTSAFIMAVAPWFIYTRARLPIESTAFVPVLVTPYLGMPVVGGLLAIGAPFLWFGFGAEI
ncbi:hypothetical protein CC79DRAFT_1129045 [Sarocladium strictum]